MVHRAWHAIQRPLTVRATGQEVRGVYGFAQMLRKALEDFQPTHLAIAFDLPTPTFRHAQFEAYKAHRPEMAPELAQQFPHVRRLMETLQVPIYEMDGLEADDLLGALSQQAEAEDVDVLILTGDTDVLQLVSPRTPRRPPVPHGGAAGLRRDPRAGALRRPHPGPAHRPQGPARRPLRQHPRHPRRRREDGRPPSAAVWLGPRHLRQPRPGAREAAHASGEQSGRRLPRPRPGHPAPGRAHPPRPRDLPLGPLPPRGRRRVPARDGVLQPHQLGAGRRVRRRPGGRQARDANRRTRSPSPTPP